jgi:hypothetical protein
MTSCLLLSQSVICPVCDAACPSTALPSPATFDAAVKRLIKATFEDPKAPPVPDISELFEVDESIQVPIVFSDPNHPAAKPNYHEEPLQLGKKIIKDGEVEFLLQPQPTDRWYVVTRGIGFCGVVHGAALWQTMVPGFNNAKGMQMPTRATAEHAYRVAIARGDVRVLSPP